MLIFFDWTLIRDHLVVSMSSLNKRTGDLTTVSECSEGCPTGSWYLTDIGGKEEKYCPFMSPRVPYYDISLGIEQQEGQL